MRVRKAIAHAINRQAIVDGAMFGFGTPIGTHFAPHHPDYIDLTAQSNYDPEKSKSLLSEAGVTVAYNSDNAEMIRRLNQEAAKAVKYGGLSEEEAWKYVTLNPAKLLRIDDKVGSIAIGKHADLVIWSHNPLSIYAVAEKTIIEGAVFYDYSKLDEKIEQNEKEREIIITQLKEAKKGGAKTQPAPVIDKTYFECETIDIVNENVQ